MNVRLTVTKTHDEISYSSVYTFDKCTEPERVEDNKVVVVLPNKVNDITAACIRLAEML